jgi:hypothetical protein
MQGLWPVSALDYIEILSAFIITGILSYTGILFGMEFSSGLVYMPYRDSVQIHASGFYLNSVFKYYRDSDLILSLDYTGILFRLYTVVCDEIIFLLCRSSVQIHGFYSDYVRLYRDY